MKLFISLLVIFIFSTELYAGLAGPIVTEMNKVFTPKDYRKLRSRNFVVKKKNINKSSWPELTIYFEVDASPLETVSLFIAYEYQRSYIPNLLKSDVIKQPSPVEVYTDYEMYMPWPISNSKYVHSTKLIQKDQSTYRVEWFMVSSNSAKIVKGSAELYPLNGKTIFKYKSFIKPKNFLAGLFKKTMIEDVLTSLTAIRDEAEKVKATPKGKSFIEKVLLALSGKYAYPNGQGSK